MSDLVQTPSQTVGPFFHFALDYSGGSTLVPDSHPAAVRLHGTVYDGAGTGIPDAMIELWQTDDAGSISSESGSLERNSRAFSGFGRAVTNLAGEYSFTTVRPGAPFATLAVFARGLGHHLFARVYFDDVADALLEALTPERRATLLAVADAHRSFRFDIRLQGEGETVFLEYS